LLPAEKKHLFPAPRLSGLSLPKKLTYRAPAGHTRERTGDGSPATPAVKDDPEAGKGPLSPRRPASVHRPGLPRRLACAPGRGSPPPRRPCPPGGLPMWLKQLQQRWFGLERAARRPRPAAARTPRARPALECLEDRNLPSTFNAATVADLIADINAANASGGTNTINLPSPTYTP